MTKITGRRFGYWVTAAILLAVISWSFWPHPVRVEVASVSQGSLVATISEEGQTRVRERYVVSAPVAGTVLRIEHEPGDEVSRDSILARFRPAAPLLLDARSRAEAEAEEQALSASLGRARADLERANAELRFARAEVERYERLAADEIVSSEQLDAVRLDLAVREETAASGRFAVAAAHHSLSRARARLSDGSNAAGQPIVQLTSPVEGVVLRRLRESESVVTAAEPLLEVGDPRQLEVVSDLLSTEAVRVRAGNRVLIEEWGGESALEGRVRLVEPYGFTKVSALGVEEQRVNVVIDLTDPPSQWQGLGDGYRVEVRIVYWEAERVTRVPTSSLFRVEESWAVFVVEQGRAEVRAVEIGHRDAADRHVAEVVSGLDVGELVIVYPGDDVVDGVKVEVR